ncbi:hypothetical protein LEP1GSC133_2955 [Leptospira borgpetersenii serovar Pomona str. 200901868]|uniref:Uncharacterized protein n=1 Tax=Leptospira borgpetersenii serovar Pomona str. 200901868 TaxID=1192866 RepID=M6WSA3_LEPBO|nr:hypothetical protein LEP1GSC133_2955 [Leptospira borgpetersenii serovar Pomona str. 200901868]
MSNWLFCFFVFIPVTVLRIVQSAPLFEKKSPFKLFLNLTFFLRVNIIIFCFSIVFP